MIRKYSLLFGLSLLVAVLAASAFALKKPAERKVNPLLNNMTHYAFPNTDGGAQEGVSATGTGIKETNTASLQTSSSAPSPGVTIGNTVYEYQSNGSNKRQVQVSNTVGDGTVIHFDWMYSPDAANAAGGKRTLRYNGYFGNTGLFIPGGASDVSPVDERTGYVVGDVNTTTGEYMAVGHHAISGQNQTRGWWDQGSGLNFWVDNRLTDAVGDDPAGTGIHFIWPAAATQNFGGQTITHVVAHEADDEQIKYFRKVGIRETGTWVSTLVLDTANNLGYTCYASKTTGKVVLAWMANIPLPGPCDTCTQSAALFVQADNDVLIKTSTNAGATWGPKRNITKNVDGVAGYRPYYDLSVMIDETDNVIATWPARQWPGDANTAGSVPAQRCRIQFWRETFAPGIIRTVAGLEYDQPECNLGVFKMNAGRTHVARCNGRTYVIWEQANDVPGGIVNDCAERAEGGLGDVAGAANSDLYVSISEDNGLTWDPARNITNTRTPGCDSATGTGGACQSEVYPTVTPFGHNFAGDFTQGGNQTPIPIPGTAGSNSGYHLEIEYVLDPHAGGAIRPEGPWFLADVKWTRLECDTSVKTPVFTGSYASIEFPAYVKPGVNRDTNFTIENSGNQTLTLSVAKFETAGPAGHLTFAGFPGSIVSGLGNTATGTFKLNSTNFVPSPVGTIVQCKGGVVFTSNAPSSPDTVAITYYITDTVIAPQWDTITVTSATKASNRKSLTVSNNGGFGNAGDGKVNLDFAAWNDCDTNLTVYLYDGSATVGYVAGADTNMFFNIFQTDWLLETGLRPVKGNVATRTRACTPQNFNLVYTGRFTTADTNITMEKTWYAPILSGTGTNDSAWIIQCLKVWNTSGGTLSNAVIGEAVDFDIPSDSGSDNSAGFNPVKNLIYQQGAEWDNDTAAGGGPRNCQAHDLRFGGVRYLGGNKKPGAGAAVNIPTPSGAYSKENSIDVYPTGTFKEKDIFTNMQATGFTVTDSITDLHTVMTFARNQTFLATDTFRFYTAWLSVRSGDTTGLFTMSDRALNWFNAKSIAGLRDTVCVGTCCDVEGDANNSGSVNVVDLTFLVARLFQGGPPPPCFEEGDVNDSNTINVVDLTYLVARLFQGGPITPCP
jgi:hypothetical protein